MKKRKTWIGLALFAFTLTGCNYDFFRKPSETTANQETGNTTKDSTVSDTSTEEEATTRKLVVASMPSQTSFYVYDLLDFSGLVINEVTYDKNNNELSSKAITDYTLSFADGTVIDDNYTLKSEDATSSDKTIIVSKDGAASTQFVIFVDQVTNFNETLTILSKPDTTSYSIGDTFSSDGLTVRYSMTYRRPEADINKTVRVNQTIDNYTLSLTIGNKSVDPTNFVLNTKGTYKVTVSYQGKRNVLTTSFNITVIDPEANESLIKLTDYQDDTINFTKDTTKMTVKFTNSNDTDTSDKGYYSPDEVENTYNIKDYSKHNAYGWHYMPSTGDVPLLVVPVVTPNESSLATTSNWNLIDKAFFGKSSDLNFESLRSYYFQASYGQLNIKGGVTDWFDPSSEDATYATESGYTKESISRLPQLALDWAVKTYGIDATKYDSDKDGYVDGIWLVYLHDIDSNKTDKWWAYTSTNGSTNGTAANPVANNYAWASLSFLNDSFAGGSGYASYYANHACDAHVLIHETGHMLGLSDYYTYSYSNYDAVGYIDMMSGNLGDHNPYSKLLLGWVTPYIVYGNATLTIESSQSQNALIVLPYDGKTYTKNASGKVEFNTFDEYLVLDYYTPKNLNASDYDCYSSNHVAGEGGRLYHVDNRLGQYNGTNTISLYSDPDTPFTSSHTNDYLMKVITNSESGNQAESYYGLPTADNAFDEIRWISADKTKLSKANQADSSSLFKTTGNSSFSISSYASQFNKTTSGTNTYYTNIKKSFSTSFKIASIA